MVAYRVQECKYFVYFLNKVYYTEISCLICLSYGKPTRKELIY